MAQTTFTGPVVSTNGFIGVLVPPVSVGYGAIFTPIATASLPAASASLLGAVAVVNDNGAGNNEFCLVICTGSAWVTCVGAALT
jgi:hypothetical protein